MLNILKRISWLHYVFVCDIINHFLFVAIFMKSIKILMKSKWISDWNLTILYHVCIGLNRGKKHISLIYFIKDSFKLLCTLYEGYLFRPPMARKIKTGVNKKWFYGPLSSTIKVTFRNIHNEDRDICLNGGRVF